MQFHFSDKAESFQPNIFKILNDKKKEMLDAGKKVYNLSVGTPDFEPDKHVMEVVSQAALIPENYKYALEDSQEMINSVKRWYERRFNVELADDEIMSVAGTQEGMAHIGLAICNDGDIVLVPNPGYPIFEVGPYLNGAKIEYYNLNKEQNFIPDLDEIPEEIARKAKMMVVSYPLNPTCTCAPVEFYVKLVAFAKKYNILIINDNAYSEIIYDGGKGFSFLSVEGAMDVGIEFNSLSKSYNLTGLRISYALGNAQVIQKFKIIRSQFDYGISYLVQKAAIAALDGPQDILARNQKKYQDRRDALCGGFRKIGWNVPDSCGTMFVWAPLPSGYSSSEKFCMDLLENTGVICTPGNSFGSLGEGYVRFALVQPVETIQEFVEIIGNWMQKNQDRI